MFVILEAYSRYTTDLAEIFGDSKTLKLLLLIEGHLAKTQADLGIIPAEAGQEIYAVATSDRVHLSRVKEIEKEIDHDLMSMVQALAEQCPKYGGFVHYGATSYDIRDTCLALQLSEAKSHLLSHLTDIIDLLVSLAEKFTHSICIGRTHGQHAVPTTHGFKFANFAYEFLLAKEQLKNVTVFGKFSGAVGTYAGFENINLESIILESLHVSNSLISTQVVSRILLLQYFQALSTIASACDHFAREVRNLQRTEIGEWFEPSSVEQIGSSTMPHKRNPHKAERVCGLSRVIASSLFTAFGNVSLEHERDLSNSSAERLLVPQTSILTDYILSQTSYIIRGLEIDEKRSVENIKLLEGRTMTEGIMLALTQFIGRQKAHALLSQLSKDENFKDAVLTNDLISTYLSNKEIIDLLNPHSYLKHISPKLNETILEIKKRNNRM